MNSTQTAVLDLLKHGPLAPSALAERLTISRQAVHRHLKVLFKAKRIKKEGKAPHLVYSLVKTLEESRVEESYLFFKKILLPSALGQKTFERGCQNLSSRRQKSAALDFAFMLDSSALYSSKIEGNSMNLNSFLNSRRQNAKVRPKEAREIEDLVEAYRFSQSHSLNEKHTLKAHGLLSRDFLNKARRGVYRKEPVGVFSAGGLEYLALEHGLVASEMEHLFEKVSKLLKQSMSPAEAFFWASWIHLMMALIHPFSDGNGRVARLCEKWFLVQKLGASLTFLPSEEFYFKNRPAYYKALKLGVNYWEVAFELAGPFITLLPQSI